MERTLSKMGTGEQDMGTVPLKREENQGEA